VAPLLVLTLLLGTDDRPDHAVTGPASGDPTGAVKAFDVVEAATGAEEEGSGAEDDGADGNKEYEHEHATTTAQSGERVKRRNAALSQRHP
jgi:hypothetical protein